MVRYRVSAPGATTTPEAEGSGKSLKKAGTTEAQAILGPTVLGGRLVVSGVIYWSRCI